MTFTPAAQPPIPAALSQLLLIRTERAWSSTRLRRRGQKSKVKPVNHMQLNSHKYTTAMTNLLQSSLNKFEGSKFPDQKFHTGTSCVPRSSSRMANSDIIGIPSDICYVQILITITYDVRAR